jgi:general secretion pathway protein D
VHQNRDISLKLLLDVSAVTGNTNIGGINQPIIGQNKIEHDIRLKEGEISLLGGLLEDVDAKTLSGFPGLSQIPILKYLFSSEHIDKRQNELVMIIIPHIVRAQDLTAFNQRAVDVGTGNVIDLRTMAAKAAPAQAPTPAQPAMPTPPQAQQQPQTPGPAPASGQPSAGPTPQTGPVTLKLEVPPQQMTVGSQFAVNAVLTGGQNIYSVPMQISYDPKLMELTDVANGTLLSQDSQPVALVHRDDASTGTLQVTASRPPNAGGISGSGIVFTMLFKAKAPGTGILNITKAQVKDGAMNNVSTSGAQAMVTIK